MSEIDISYKGSTIASMNASGTKTLLTQGKYCEDDIEVVYTRPSAPTPSLQTKSVSYTPSETAQSATVTADSGYDGLGEVDVSVAAVSSTYVGSGITRRSSTDMTASGATVIAPAGYYSSSASKSVATGTAGTPTASKGTVSNHSVAVTPSVTNTTGYITGGTKTGTAVTVSASELVSGTKSISSNGTAIDVTNYASVDVAVSPSLQSKNKMFTPTESEQAETITADTGYDGLSSVQATVRAIPENYVYSTIPRRDSTDLAVSGYTVTAPIGYYASNASKTINVPIVTGTFTTGSSSGASSVSLGYSGSGYPIAAMVFVSTGAGSSTVVKRYGIVMWSMSKAAPTTAPVHGSDSSNTADMGATQTTFKNSTSDATVYSRNSSINTASYMNSNASNNVHTCCRLKSNTTLSYYVIGSSSYGLLPSTTYKYIVIYSS